MVMLQLRQRGWMTLLLLQPVSSFLHYHRRLSIHALHMNGVDYEYIPPENNPSRLPVYETDLDSSYGADTPAGLRGEAVRSALRSSRCVGWNLMSSPLRFGIVKIDGEGVLDFINNKLTSTFGPSTFGESCLLTAKGRLIDRVCVGTVSSSRAYVLSSPGHKAQSLFEILNKAVFKLDKVELSQPNTSCIFTLASTKQSNLEQCFHSIILPKLDTDTAQLPASNQMAEIEIGDGGKLCVFPTSGLPANGGFGYTFCFIGTDVGQPIWEYLVSEQCQEGPVEVGALEYESLRIECGSPRFGWEMTALSDGDTDSSSPPSPLELNLDACIDVEKGCYLGQEGIASMFKNPRGPPRRLYQIVFDDLNNLYDHQSEGEYTSRKTENLTRLPQRRDSLFVLGSNEKIKVGEITSVAEPNSTGDPVTVALCLAKRPDSILKSMKDMELDIPLPEMNIDDNSGMIQPKDPLEGIEVIVGGTFTVGKLRKIPKRLFVDDVPDFVKELPGEDEMNDIIDVGASEDSEANLLKAQQEAEEAAAEAQRKAEKLELLKKRAEEAMARRKQRNS